MIHYRLKCADGHDFDGWFASSAAFDRQREQCLLSCPACGTADVDRALMAPALSRAQREKPVGQRPAAEDATQHKEDAPRQEVMPPTPANVALDDGRAAELRQALRALKEAVEKHGVDVGRDFPEEARRIHYGEAEPRGIYGQADLEEARDLVEEGIEILPIPVLPDERN